MNAHPPANVRRALERGRDFVEGRQEEDRAYAQRRKEFQMTHRKSKHGLVRKPPSLDSIRKDAEEAVVELREAVLDVNATDAADQVLNQVAQRSAEEFMKRSGR